MEPSNSDVSMPSESSSTLPTTCNSFQTEIKVEFQHVKHTWTVKNFSYCYQEYLENFIYLHRGEETLTWSIKIYPKGNGENNKDFVFLCLNRVVNNSNTHNSCKGGKIGFTSRFILRTSEMKEIEMRIHPNPSHSDYVSYIKRDVLFPQIHPSDSIIVNVEIDVAVETITTPLDEIKTLQTSSDARLMEDFLRILKDDVLTDFTIIIGAHRIRAHRAILAARSPVFCAMLKHEETDEVKTGMVTIKDIDVEIFTELLNFIYCGRCLRETQDMSFASELLVAADKYRIDELKYRCENALIKAISCDNVCELLVTSDIFNAPRLKSRAVDFVIQHPRNITSTRGWESLVREHPLLVTDIVRQFDKSGERFTSENLFPNNIVIELSVLSDDKEIKSSLLGSKRFGT